MPVARITVFVSVKIAEVLEPVQGLVKQAKVTPRSALVREVRRASQARDWLVWREPEQVLAVGTPMNIGSGRLAKQNGSLAWL